MLTFEEVVAAIGPVEPNYENAAQLGPDALPHLDRMIFGSGDPDLAMKATSLVGHIRDPRSLQILRRAALHDWAQVRASAAHIAGLLSSDDAVEVLLPLLQDPDPAIRQIALNSASTTRAEAFRDAVSFIAENDVFPELREQAKELSASMKWGPAPRQ
jgi:HEAT repeat protein